MRALVAALALALASPAVAGEAPTWRPVDAEAGQIRDIDGLEQLARDFPDSGSVRLRLLQPYLEADEIEKLFDTLAWLKERGYVFGEVPQSQIPKLVGEAHADRARDLLLPDAEVVEASEVVATVPAEAGLVESVHFSAATGKYFVTSVTRNGAFVGGSEGQWNFLNVPRANDLSGVVADPKRNVGWVASANIDGSQEQDQGFAGLIGLRTGSEAVIYAEAPEGVVLSDLALGPDGVVYASDPLGGGVYRLSADEAAVVTLIPPGTFRSPQGLTVTKDGRRLYVSDYRYGLAWIGLDTGEVSRLESDIPVILDGTDGLWLHGNELIAMQNGTSPMRVSAFELSEDGTRVIGHRVLEQAHPGWTEPLGGSISGDALVYVATGQWDRFVKGEPAQDKPAIATEIRRLPLE